MGVLGVIILASLTVRSNYLSIYIRLARNPLPARMSVLGAR